MLAQEIALSHQSSVTHTHTYNTHAYTHTCINAHMKISKASMLGTVTLTCKLRPQYMHLEYSWRGHLERHSSHCPSSLTLLIHNAGGGAGKGHTGKDREGQALSTWK